MITEEELQQIVEEARDELKYDQCVAALSRGDRSEG